MTCVLVLGVGTLGASTVTVFETASTVKDTAGDPVNAKATFVIDANGKLTLTLENLQTNMKDVGQAITGVKFTVSNLSAAATLSATSGDLIKVGSQGTVTDQGVQSLSLWSAGTSLHTVSLAGLPKDTILGPSNNGVYSSGNGSIDSNKGHNPFVAGTATFVFNALPGYNSGTTISDVLIGFGTAGNNYLVATVVTPAPPVDYTTTPEPSTFGLLGISIAALLVLRKRIIAGTPQRV
ncbi:MAG TPA: PEP-CTERM sorting domain-containing protein [Bryobacteraceae bacterium]|nr:PEP-CTERM sorting domain-containing protein [Bryobacteraceae bacterium]